MKQNKILKVLVPLGMVFIIAGIWMYQNQMENQNKQETNQAFPLQVESIDVEELSAYELPMIIDFGANDCVPCKEMAPILVTLNEEMQGKAIIQFVDVWETPGAATGFPIQVIPTQVFVNADGTPYTPSFEVENSIQFTMYKDSEYGTHIFTVHQGGLSEDEMRLILEDMGVE